MAVICIDDSVRSPLPVGTVIQPGFAHPFRRNLMLDNGVGSKANLLAACFYPPEEINLLI